MPKDLMYLIDEIIKSDKFWQVNYYIRSMKKAPHGGVIRVYSPNLYLKFFNHKWKSTRGCLIALTNCERYVQP